MQDIVWYSLKQLERLILEYIEEALENMYNEDHFLQHREKYLLKKTQSNSIWSLKDDRHLPIKLDTFSPFFGSYTCAKLFPAAKKK
jgi:hypothetical protein